MKISWSRSWAATTRTMSTQAMPIERRQTTADARQSWLAEVMGIVLAQQSGGFRRPSRSMSAMERGSRRVIGARRGGDR